MVQLIVQIAFWGVCNILILSRLSANLCNLAVAAGRSVQKSALFIPADASGICGSIVGRFVAGWVGFFPENSWANPFLQPNSLHSTGYIPFSSPEKFWRNGCFPRKTHSP